MKSRWLISPRLSAWQKAAVKKMKALCPNEPSLIWFLSSGTQSVDRVKAIGLSRSALECSARAVNRFLKVQKKDRWLLCLPTYHIGGYAVLVRAKLSGSKVFQISGWNPEAFVNSVRRNKITLCSLVPTQLHDLVAAGIHCPQPLRAVVIGGGALSPDLYQKARELGWPVLPSYGLTECSSQVATAGLSSLRQSRFPALDLLPHVQIKLVEGRIFIQSKAACSLVATMSRDGEFTLESPLRAGWLPTEDLAEIRSGRMVPLGRRDDIVKVLGVLVSLHQVEHDLQKVAGLHGKSLVVIARLAAREGARLVAVSDGEESLLLWEKILKSYNAQAAGPARVHQFCWVPEIPRTTLGKVKREALRAKLMAAKADAKPHA